MVVNGPGPPGYTTMDWGMAGNAGNSSSEEALADPISLSGPSAVTSRGAPRSAPLLFTVPFVSTNG